MYISIKYSIQIIILITIETIFSFKQENSNSHSYISNTKHIDCGLISLQNESNRSENLIVNLTSCLSHRNEKYFNSFTTHFNSKSLQAIFNDYFFLDDKKGLVYVRKKIDRESFCTRLKSEKQQVKLKLKKDKLLSQTEHTNENLNCDCNLEKCELKFRFVAFREDNERTRLKKKKLQQNLKTTVHKYLSFRINIRDLNDNIPKFLKNFLYLNISEHIGMNNFDSSLQANLKGKKSCNLIKTSLNKNFNIDLIFTSNNVIPIDKVLDVDGGKNSIINYDLILLSKNDLNLIEQVENETDHLKQETFINDLIDNYKQDCMNMFELIESNLGDDYNSNYDKDLLVDSSDLNLVNNQNNLFLKINTYLDREQQENYNFILIASDQNKTQLEDEKNFKIKNKNFIFIRLLINDLNDNQPKFIESKFSFFIPEIVSYVPNDNYIDLLNRACSEMRKNLVVKAIDLDTGLNSMIKYKVMQQLHRKNPNLKQNPFYSSEINSEFIIDQQNGSIYLSICNHLNDKSFSLDKNKFTELSYLLDFETFIKHTLVIEASDSDLYNPLQSVVTVEINLLDVNDNQPFIISLYSTECGLSSTDTLNEMNKLNISIQNFNKNDDNLKYSTKIIIEGVSEYSKVNRCLGQFLVTDLDTPKENRKIETVLIEPGNLIKFKNLKDDNQIYNYEELDSFNYFSSYSQTSEIFEMYLNFEPDAELERVYEITIEIKDNGKFKSLTSRTQLILIIQDENDHLPKFEKELYNFNIDEWNKFDDNSLKSFKYCFGKLEATDLDSTLENSFITYDLDEIDNLKIGSNTKSSDIFYINQSTGDLCVKNRTLLDKETKSGYNLLVKASNKNSSVFTTTQVQVNLNDLNDNTPEFLEAKYTFFVAEKDSNLVRSLLITDLSKTNNHEKFMNFVGTVMAIDRDHNDQNRQIYYYLNRNDKSYLELNSKNLENSLLKYKNNIQIDQESHIDQNISDENEPEVENEPDIYDSLIDENDFVSSSSSSSSFDNIIYQVTAIKHNVPKIETNFNKSSDEFIFSFNNLEDKTSSVNRKMDKKILREIENINDLIYVNSTTGSVYLLQKIDREQILSIKFFIFAKDRRDNSGLNSSVPVTIEIIDINDSKPTCSSLNSDEDLILNKKSSQQNQEMTSRNKPIDSFALKFDLDQVLTTRYKMARIYKFNCKDNDLNKNAELKYEIEKYFTKSYSDTSMDSIGDENDTNIFLKFHKFFYINSQTGVFYVNLDKSLLGDYEANEILKKFTQLTENRFLFIKFRVSDNGLVSLSNSYYLKFFICFGDDDYSNLCDFKSLNKSYQRPVLVRKILNSAEIEEDEQEKAKENEDRVKNDENYEVNNDEDNNDDEYEEETSKIENLYNDEDTLSYIIKSKTTAINRLNQITKKQLKMIKDDKNDLDFQLKSSSMNTFSYFFLNFFFKNRILIFTLFILMKFILY